MRIKAPFSYYGGKSKIIDSYPAPKHNLIIEPFAGSAAYCWRHRDGHSVHVNDLDPTTYAIWNFLTNAAAIGIVRKYVPDVVEAGMKCSDMVPNACQVGGAVPLWRDGLLALMRSEANQGTQGARGVHDQITKMGAKCWKIRRKMEVVIPAVRDWKVTNLDYKDLPDVEATWFIDPPYSNAAGRRYRAHNIDYAELGDFCRSRRGQVIVTENVGATWLPFQPIEHRRVSIRSRYQRANVQEAMWTNE